jgi:hypothetical protein
MAVEPRSPLTATSRLPKARPGPHTAKRLRRAWTDPPIFVRPKSLGVRWASPWPLCVNSEMDGLVQRQTDFDTWPTVLVERVSLSAPWGNQQRCERGRLVGRVCLSAPKGQPTTMRTRQTACVQWGVPPAGEFSLASCRRTQSGVRFPFLLSTFPISAFPAVRRRTRDTPISQFLLCLNSVFPVEQRCAEDRCAFSICNRRPPSFPQSPNRTRLTSSLKVV